MLGDPSQPISEIELNRILRELRAVVERVDAGWILLQIGACYGRLGRPAKALEECNRALQRLREPTELRAMALCNRGTALARLNRYQESALSCIEAARIPSGDRLLNLGNLAEALDRLGDRDAALQVFREALDIADFTKTRDCFVMAAQAAELGLDAEAVELFARFVARKTGADIGERSAVEIIRAATNEGQGALNESPSLSAAIRRATAMADELTRLAARDPRAETPNEGAEADALDVLEATRHLREAAIAHVVEPDARGEA
jgi:tetratricopeptide (TPR) repeat protein